MSGWGEGEPPGPITRVGARAGERGRGAATPPLPVCPSGPASVSQAGLSGAGSEGKATCMTWGAGAQGCPGRMAHGSSPVACEGTASGPLLPGNCCCHRDGHTGAA